MAVKPVSAAPVLNQPNALLVQWTNLANLDTGEPFSGADFSDRTVQMDGTFGVGGSITLQGSNDGTNWFAIVDPQGVAITLTNAGLKVTVENPLYIRPAVTAGDGSTLLNCRLWIRRGRISA